MVIDQSLSDREDRIHSFRVCPVFFAPISAVKFQSDNQKLPLAISNKCSYN